MDPIHAELWERRLSDITAVPMPVVCGMHREAVDLGNKASQQAQRAARRSFEA